MTAERWIAALALGLALAAPLPQTGRAEAAAARPDLPQGSFTLCCPRPDWWDQVEAPQIHDRDEFDHVWQDRSLTDRVKAKALFDLAERLRERDPDLAAPAFAYFGSVARDYPYLRGFYEFAVAQYLDYDRPLEGYAGQTGDLTAVMVRKLADIYIDQGDPAPAVPLLRYMLEVRGPEVNDHLKELMALGLGRALDATGQPAAAVDALVAARDAYDGDWEARIDDALGGLRDEMGLAYYLHDRRVSLPAALAALCLLAVLLVFLRRRPRRQV